MPHAHYRRAGSAWPANEACDPPGDTARGAGSRGPASAESRLRWIAATAAVLFGLVACGGSTTPESTPALPAPTAASTPAAAAVATPSPTPSLPPAFAGIGTPVSLPAGEIGSVVWARAIDPSTKAPVDRAATFSADAKAIYAVVPVIRLAPDARLTASWSYNDTSLDAFAQTVTAGGQPGARWIEFHLTRVNATPWPEGTYAIALRLGDGVVQSASVTVADGS